MNHAIFSLHSPPREIDSKNRCTMNGKEWIKCGVPLWVATTREEAIAWQTEKRKEMGL